MHKKSTSDAPIWISLGAILFVFVFVVMLVTVQAAQQDVSLSPHIPTAEEMQVISNYENYIPQPVPVRDIAEILNLYNADSGIVESTIASTPGRLRVVEALWLSTTSPKTSQTITARFKVRNIGGQTLTLQSLTAGARLGSNWNGEVADFPSVTNIQLKPNAEYAYQKNWAYWKTGNYFAEPVVKINGNWGGIENANRVSFTVQQPPPPPPAAPSNPRMSNITTNSITFSWSDNSNNEQGFKIERRNGGNWSQITTIGANSTNYTSGGLNAGTQYCFRVRAYNGGGDSAFSNDVCATTTQNSISSGPDIQAARTKLKSMSAMQSPWAQVDAPIKNSSGQRSATMYQAVIEQFDVALADFAKRYKPDSTLPDTRCNIFAGDVMRAMGAPLPTKGNLGLGRNGYPNTDPMTANAPDLNSFLNGRIKSSDSATLGWRLIDPTNASGLQQLINHVNAGKPAVASNSGHIAVIRPNQQGVTRWQDLRTAQAGANNFLNDRLEIGFAGAQPQFFIHD